MKLGDGYLDSEAYGYKNQSGCSDLIPKLLDRECASVFNESDQTSPYRAAQSIIRMQYLNRGHHGQLKGH